VSNLSGAATPEAEFDVTSHWLDKETAATISGERLRMVYAQLRLRGIRDERVLAAMSKVPREEFAEADSLTQAYGDYPLPIGAGQTVSQPYDCVLEIGTGTGYEAAVLGEIAAEVWTIERVAELARKAQEILARLGYDNVHVVERDGTLGLPEHAPYPKILVAAAAPGVPESLIAQLAEGGSLVIPIGSRAEQQIHLIRKFNGEAVTTKRELCRFVPLVGQEGWKS
jgi:protein-L-isoaspartate(D-aspartate) O-methyltransferase